MRVPDDTKLTPRERQVLELIGLGLRGRAVAERLGMAYFTMRKHRLRLLAKLGLTSAAQLSAAAAAIVGEAPRPDRPCGVAGTT